ncbi:MAG: FAD-dependent oxidoreductase [Candidatus Bipolaricaulota bacterium]|nr:FAD-dependent oxidoreductase [Candidatus Bipolaricaulota bacterium]
MKRSKGSVLEPFAALKYLFIKPQTLPYPFQKLEVSERYRGFHRNDLNKCIGCGNCHDICPCDAITMVPVPGIEATPKKGDKGERPQFNYGRCTYCGLCVDVCPTGSLSLSQDFIHIDHDAESFVSVMARDERSAPEVFVEDPSDLEVSINHRKRNDKGFSSEPEFCLADFEGQAKEMEVLPAEDRLASFVELVRGFTRGQALTEAARCFECALCEEACPAHMNIVDYIRDIWNDDPEGAARDIYKTNPLPDVCGRVCTHDCETACALANRGDPVSIRWLKRYAMDQIPRGDYRRVLGTEIIKSNGKKVAIVGAGPAGLSAGYYLTLMGYEVTIFEEKERPGGMMRYGIPEYRLPYAALDKDISYIESIGVDIRCDTRVGEDVTLDDLHHDYEAVFIGIGLQGGRSTRVPGTDHPHVFQAIDLLRRITGGEEIEVTEKIVVIGGGNVAMDISRSLARMQRARYGEVNLTTTCLETEEIMPADLEEIEEAREEGIMIIPGRSPKKIEIENGEIKGLHTIECVSVFDEEGRFNPTVNESDELFIPGTMVVEAIGQSPDASLITEDVQEKLEYAGRRVKVNEHYQSSIPWLFFGGDFVKGPDVITAIATGHAAARGIDLYFVPESRVEGH